MRIVIVFLTLVLAASIALAQQSVLPPPKPVNDATANAEVLKLLRAGVSERTILHVISAAAGTFDTSADALATLKQAGATEAELSAIVAQDAAPANAPPAGAQTNSGPSLAETVQFIQDKVNQQGRIVFVESSNNTVTGESSPPTKYSIETHVVIADPAGGLSFQESYKYPWGDQTNTWQLYFKDVAKLEVLSHADWVHRKAPGLEYQVDPPYFELFIHLAAGKTLQMNRMAVHTNEHGKTYRGNDNVGEFVLHFRDEETADRVAKAMIHAVELCGGGSKPEPF